MINFLPALSEQAIVALTVALSHLALLGYLIIKNDPKKYLNYLLLAYLSLACGWDTLIFWQTSRLSGPFAEDYPLIFILPLIPLAMFAWLYTSTFLQLKSFKLWGCVINALLLMLLITAQFSTLSLFPIVIPFISPTLDRDSFLFWGGAIIFAVYTGASIWNTIAVQKNMVSPRHRNRAQFLQLAIWLIAIGVALYFTLTPLCRQIGLITHWIGGSILVYLHLNRNLPDIKSTFKELTRLSILTLFTLGVYSATMYALEKLFAGTGQAHLKMAVSAAVLLTLLFPLLREILDGLIQRVLFRHKHNYAQIIKTYVQTINNILFMKDLVSVSLDFLKENLGITRGAFFLLKKQDNTHYHFSILSNLNGDLPPQVSLKKKTPLIEQLVDHTMSLSQYHIDIAPEFGLADSNGVHTLKEMAFEQYFPIKRNNNLIAILAVGPFASGHPYFLQDIELLSTIADQTSIALENARLFEDVRYNLEEITQMNDLMDNIFSSIQSGVITVDNENRITTCNKAARKILNLPELPVLNQQKIDLMMVQFENTPLPALLRDVKANRRSYHAYEINQYLPNRGPVNLSIDLTPLEDARGQMKGVAVVINDLTENRRLQVVQNLFRKYLSPAVVDRLPDDPSQLKLGGHRQEVTILFGDIRGFSTFSEHQDPEDLINVLNRYLSMAAEAILVYEGTLDKFMGDAVMAIFNAPLPQPDHPLRAVKAAAAMQRTIAESHQKLGKYAPQLNFGVGIHVGEAIIGNVGTQSRMDYTAIGDAVNLAKRIQENTPGGRVLLSSRAYERVKNHVIAVPYKELKVKGREATEQTYELLNVH